jgi:hypothetical protein
MHVGSNFSILTDTFLSFLLEVKWYLIVCWFAFRQPWWLMLYMFIVLIGSSCNFFGEMSVQILAHLKNWVVFFIVES